METKPNRYITVAYKLYAVEDGEKDFVEEAQVAHPFQFISGLGTTLDTFENQIIALNKDDNFEFTIPCAEAYGEYRDEHVIDLPKDIFMIDGRFDSEMIQEGKVVPLMNEDDQVLHGTVVEVKEDIVIVDMNHPLAGADLLFTGKVIENRDATTEEIQGMINVLSGEGCNCGGCGGGCGEDGCSDDDCGHDHGCANCH